MTRDVHFEIPKFRDSYHVHICINDRLEIANWREPGVEIYTDWIEFRGGPSKSTAKIRDVKPRADEASRSRREA